MKQSKLDIKIIGLILLLVVIFFLPACLKNGFIFSGDGLTYFYPLKFYASYALKNGSLGFWNPYISGGTPFLAEPQVGVFYPLEIIFSFLPTLFAMNLIFFLHIGLAGIFCYLFARVLRMSRFGSFVSSVIFMFSGFVFAHTSVGHLDFIRIYTWTPLIFFFLERMFLSGKLKYAVFASIALAIQILGGYPQMISYSLIAIFLYFVFRMLCLYQDKTPFKPMVKLSLHFLLFLIWGILLSMFQVLPSLEFSSYISRVKPNLDYFFSFSLPPTNLITFIVPFVFGGRGEIPYFGPGLSHEFTIYMGFFSLVLFLIALLIKRNKFVVFFSFLFVFSLVMAMGKYGLIYRIMFYLPIYNKFRIPAQFVFLLPLGVSMVSGFGASALFEKISAINIRRIKKIAFILIILSLVIFLAITAFIVFKEKFELAANSLVTKFVNSYVDSHRELMFSRQYYIDKYRNLLNASIIPSLKSSAFRVFSLAFMSGLLLLLIIKVNNIYFARVMKVALVLIVLVDLWSFGFGLIYPIKIDPESDLYLVEDKITEFLKEDEDIYRIAPNPHVNPFPFQKGILFGIQDVGSTVPMVLLWYREFCNLINTGDAYSDLMGNNTQITSYLSKLLPLLNVKYVIDDKDTKDSNLKLAFRDKNIGVYRLGNFLPRAFDVYAYRVAPDKDDRINELMADWFNPTKYLILEEDPQARTGKGKFGEAKIEIKRHLPERIDIEAEFKDDGFLFLSEVFYPHWKAFIDGAPTKVYKTNHAFQSIFVNKGKHDISFRYCPESFRRGLIITLMTALVVFIAGITVKR